MDQPSTALPTAIESREGWLDPFDWYRDVLDDGIAYSDEHNRWNVFAYDLVNEVLKDEETFTADHMATEELSPENLLETTLLNADPPEHTRLKSSFSDAFHPEAIHRLEPVVEEITESLLDDVLGKGKEGDEREGDDGGGDTAADLDVITQLAGPLPSKVIARILGLPQDDWQQFREWSRTVVVGPRGVGDDPEELRETQKQVQRDVWEYLKSVLDRDSHSGLLARLDQNPALSEREVLETAAIVLVSGNITTTNLIANAIRCLDDNYDSFAAMPTSGDRLAGAIEETLRLRSPTQNVIRVCERPTEIGGERIESGELVMLWLGAANRDGSVFENPDEFRPEREPSEHLAFANGVHRCPGSALARLEARTLLENLFERITDFEIVEEPLRPTTSPQIYGVRSLEIRVVRGS
jgi:cytochrome P450